MRDKKSLQIRLVRILLADQQANNKLGVPRKKILLVSSRAKEISPFDEISNYHARIPQLLDAARRGNLDLVRTAFAVGRFRGIALTMLHNREAEENSRGGSIITKVF